MASYHQCVENEENLFYESFISIKLLNIYRNKETLLFAETASIHLLM